MMDINYLQLSDEQLAMLVNRAQEEQERRRKLSRAKLIENFHDAWIALQVERIRIKYYPDDWDDNYLDLSDWDAFDFN